MSQTGGASEASACDDKERAQGGSALRVRLGVRGRRVRAAGRVWAACFDGQGVSDEISTTPDGRGRRRSRACRRDPGIHDDARDMQTLRLIAVAIHHGLPGQARQ